MMGLGIDGGGSSTRWLLCDDSGAELASGTVGPVTGHASSQTDIEAMNRRLRSMLLDVLEHGAPDAVVAGITGLHPGQRSSELSRLTSDVLGLHENRVSLVNDMDIAYAGAFSPGEGVIVYAGTGSIAYHVRRDGTTVRAGGHGYLIDDVGGGFWIGRQALKRVLRRADESGAPPQTPLARSIYSALGSDDWEQIVTIVYGGGRERIAALAPAVATAAEQGDEHAARILREAGAELGRLSDVMFTRLGSSLPVAFAGGIARLSPVLTASLAAALPPGAKLLHPTVEPVAAAALMALDLADRA